jgi:hypothetical protein
MNYPRKGTLLLIASSRAVCFKPKSSIWLEVGPIKAIPWLSHKSQNSAFSTKNHNRDEWLQHPTVLQPQGFFQYLNNFDVQVQDQSKSFIGQSHV